MEIDCGGCEGTARIKIENDENRAPSILDDSASKNIEIAASLLNNFSIFQLLDEDNKNAIYIDNHHEGRTLCLGISNITDQSLALQTLDVETAGPDHFHFELFDCT